MSQLSSASSSAALGSDEVVALGEIAAEGPQADQLVEGLDALGGDVQPDGVGELDHALDDGGVEGVPTETGHEGVVDLDPVHRKPLEVGEGRISGTEIVDGEPDAQVAESAERVALRFDVFDQDAFGEFEAEDAGIDVVGQKDGTDRLQELGAVKLAGRDVDIEERATTP